MSIVFFLKNLIGTLLLPPANGLLLLVAALIFRRRRGALAIAVVGGALILVQSLPIVAHALIAPLEARAGGVFVSAQRAGAIVILGSGVKIDAPEYAGDTANERSLIRLRYGLSLARQTHLPVLITGGVATNASRSEAEVLARIAEKEFATPVRWQERESKDTAENAALSARILKQAGIHRVVLVTQAFHMPRARLLFEAAGLEVVPAPTDFMSRPDSPYALFDFLPQPRAVQTSYYALHEWLGLAWAMIRNA